MQNQLSQIWRQFQKQPPLLQASLLLTPFLAAAVVVLAAVLMAGPRPAIRASEPTPSPAPTRPNEAVVIVTAPAATTTATASPVPAAPVIVATLAPTPEPPATPTPSPLPSNGYRVVNTEGVGASLRREPGPSGQRIKVIPENREVEALGPTREVGGTTWRSVRDDDGDVGWIATEFLSNVRADPRATATPAPLTIQVVDLTEAPARGEEATVTIRTRPGVRCEIRVFLYGPSTLPREGLAPMTADDEGLCSWTWRVPEETVSGTWRYLFAVGIGDRQVTREASFTVR